MSTRSGKRIHTSLLEDTATTDQEPAVKSEKKTRSKRQKENLDHIGVSIFKNKKRNNYVSYPTDDELLRDTATVTATKNEGETKPSRALRKNALKEHNPVENSDQVESQTEAKSLIRKSRRFKRGDGIEETDNHENVPAEVTEVPKSKKSKKKKKVEAVIDNPPEEAPAKKSKKKKKRGKRTSSTIVEDVPQNNNSKNGIFNRSATSVDSFHSAAGSPLKNENIVRVPDKVNTLEKTEEINKPKTNRKNNKKNSIATFDKNDESINMEIDKVDENKNNNKITKNRKPASEEIVSEKCFVSVSRDNLEKGLEDILNIPHLSNREPKRRKSNTRDATFDNSNISTNLEKDVLSNLNVSNVNNGQIKRRKSNIKEMEVSLPENMLEDVDDIINNDTFDNERRKNSVVKDVTFDKSNASSTNEIVDNNADVDVSNISNKQLKTRRSMVKGNTFDKSNAPIDKEIVDNNVDTDLNVSNISNKLKTRRSMIKDNTFDKSNAKEVDTDLNVSNKFLKTRRYMIKDSTFDKSNASIDKEIVDNNVDTDLNVSNISNQLKTRRSMIKDNTFDKSNAKEVDTDLNVSNKFLKTRRSMIKDSTFDKSNASIVKEGLVVEIDLNVSKKHSTGKSISKDSTFDKSNASITNFNNILKDTEPDLNVSNISNKQLKRRKSNVKDSTFDKQESVLNTTFEKETENDKETIKDYTFNKSNSTHLDETYEKDTSTSKRKEKKSSVNTTYDKTDKAEETTFEKDMAKANSFDAFKKGAMSRKSSIRDASFDNSNFSITSLTKEDFEKDNNIISSSATKRRSIRHTFDKNDTISENAVNTTYEKTEDTDNNELKRKSPRISKTPDIQTILNTTFEKESTNERKENFISSSKSSLISSDNSSIADKSDISRISIISDDTSEHLENIVNTTPLLIESSIDDSHISIIKQESPKPQTPLKREGTFTKDDPEVPTETELGTPTKSKSVPTAGCTPYHVTKSSQKKSMMNVTRSLEKGVRAMVDPTPRLTRVMFCSPVDNPALFTQEKKKIIKSNLKGSNKSFFFDETASMSRPGRKRSYTQNDADDSRVKRTRLTEDLQHSVDRLSRPRTASATGKLAVTTPKKPPTPSKPKSVGKAPRTKLPNFAAMHQKQFDKMESLDECQERRAKRAKQLLTPTAPPGLLERISPKNNTESPKKSKELAKPKEKIDTPTKKLPTLESLRPGFTRFGFKLNLDVNPFSIPSKTTEKSKEKPVAKSNGLVPRQGMLPSLAGATSVRREVAKLTVMREKSFTDRRNMTRNENRTVIKGVRTNRRFELQMKMRNID